MKAVLNWTYNFTRRDGGERRPRSRGGLGQAGMRRDSTGCHGQ